MVQLTQLLSGGHALLGGAIVISILLILGIFVEVLPLIIIFTLTLAPLGIAFGYDPIHWGLLMVMSMNIGGITPRSEQIFSSRRALQDASCARWDCGHGS
jgi:TRAP-type C4-dicarboxylate transport system permease large subunit